MTDWANLKIFIGEAKKHKLRFGLAFLLMPLTAYLAVQGPAFIQGAIDLGYKAQDREVLINFAYLFVFVVSLEAVISLFLNLLLQSGGIRTLSDLRKRVVEHISFMGRGDYEKRPVGVLVSRATSDIESIGETFLQGISYLITDSMKIIAVIWYIFTQDTTLGWLTVSILPPVIFMVNFFRIKLRRLYDDIRSVNGRLSASINESVSMLKEIRLFNLRSVQEESFCEQSHAYRDKSVKAISMEAFIYSFLEALLYITIGGSALLFTLYIGFDKAVTLGLFVAWISLLHQLFEPIKEMGSRFAVLQAAFAAMGKIGGTLAIPLPHDQGKESVHSSSMVLEELSFYYREDEPVLKKLNLQIPAGSSLAIVGPTGSGKSTLLSLLSRLYEPVNGEIRIGDKPLPMIERNALKNHMVLVPQEPAIFHETLFFNVTLGREDISLDMIESMAQASGLKKFIDSLPHAYETVLDEGGASLSSGQRQLVALMRALVSPAKILIFDEATANIDTETERLIQHTINYAMSSKTVILVAHRLSTIRDADQIAVLVQGELNGLGTHQELLKDCHYYRCLHELEDVDHV
jgi:ATP-binding cassette, subfamily B, multidrug efflux pump